MTIIAPAPAADPLPDLAAVRALDDRDPLRDMRDRFHLPPGMIYLDGNSLGALPRGTPGRVREAIETQWGEGLIASWNTHGWIGMPQRLGEKIAPLIGARRDEVVVADSTSVNLYKLIVAALDASPDRNVILGEPGNFPTDLYVADGAARSVGRGARVRTVPVDRIVEAIDDDVALLLLTHVHYKSGAMLDMAAITAAAHARGALVLWDLSHSVGAVPVDLNGSDADLAVGCGYKYLNGGPGAPAFLYVAERHRQMLRSPLSGWMGHAAPFAFDDEYIPSDSMDRFLCGTPPILAMAALEQGLAMFGQIDFAEIVRKSRALCALYIALMEARCGDHGFALIGPRDPERRGSHVSFRHDHAYAICRALIARGVIGDFRAPDVLRMGFTPLYTRYEDVWRAVETIDAVMRDKSWDHPDHHRRATVT
jgi:kynureninase